jgi:hypothetical protein
VICIRTTNGTYGKGEAISGVVCCLLADMTVATYNNSLLNLLEPQRDAVVCYFVILLLAFSLGPSHRAVLLTGKGLEM